MGDTGQPLLERSGELERLRSGLESARAGGGSVWAIEGAPGTGKTALLAAAERLAGELGFGVLQARAGPLEGGLGWNLVRQLFAGVIAAGEPERAELLAGAAALAAPALGLEGEGETGAFHGLYWLTAELAAKRPLLLAVDDAFWGDLPSLGFLAYLGARVADLPLALVLTTRSGERGPEPLDQLRAAAETLALRELSLDATGTLVRSSLGAGAADEFCAACQAATRGNPYLLHELLTELRRDRVAPAAERAGEVAGITPDAVRRSVLLRLARLPEEARELAAAVAILGGGTRLADAAGLAGLEPEAAARAADALADAGILVEGRELSFAHPLVGEVLYTSLGSHERAQRHSLAARLLADAGADPQRVGAQLLVSEPDGDRWVVERLREAAAEAIDAGAPAAAVELLARALAEPPDGERRGAVLSELGRAEGMAGAAGALDHLREAASLAAEGKARAAAGAELGRALYVSGHPLRAAEEFDRALGELAATGIERHPLTPQLQAAWLIAARLEVPLRPRAAALIGELELAPPAGETFGERVLLAQLANELVFAGRARETALALAHAALGDGALIREETSDGLAWTSAIAALGWSDDFDDFDAGCELALADARRRGSRIGFATASYALSFTRFHRGLLVDAIADAEQAIAAAAEGWSQFLSAARAQLAWALIERGELVRARIVLDEAPNDPGWEHSTMRALVLEARARLELARSEPEAALASALAAGQIAVDSLAPNPAILPWRSRAAEAAAMLGDTERAEGLLSDAIALARRFGAPRAIGTALVAAGIARRQEGVEALEEAVEVLADSPARLEHARALVHLGAALRRRGKSRQARDVLRAGIDASARCDATRLAEYAQAELAAAGGRRRSPAGEGEALTPAELRVAELATQDMSNREIAQALFVSLRTVETHLTHTYRKLGIESRAKLGEALRTEKTTP